MTLTMAYESATRRTGRKPRPFTPEEDETLRRLAAEGHTRWQIADAMGRPYWTIHSRAQMIGITFTAYAPGGHQCRCCTILLSAAPVGHSDLCGWCANDN